MTGPEGFPLPSLEPRWGEWSAGLERLMTLLFEDEMDDVTGQPLRGPGDWLQVGTRREGGEGGDEGTAAAFLSGRLLGPFPRSHTRGWIRVAYITIAC